MDVIERVKPVIVGKSMYDCIVQCVKSSNRVGKAASQHSGDLSRGGTEMYLCLLYGST